MSEFAFDLRVLTCGNCSAPLDVPNEGGTVKCSYCGATSAYGVRARARVGGGSALSERERVARLRAQPPHVTEVPADIVDLLVDGLIPDERIPEAKARLTAARTTLAAAPDDSVAQARVFVLTTQVGGRAGSRENRALTEAALELLPPGLHSQHLYGKLARGAAGAGDLVSAEEWLALLEGRSELLQLDSIYRVTAAYVGTARGDFPGVLDVLTCDGEHVPIVPDMAVLSETLRTNALEKLGRFDEAVRLMASVLAVAPGIDRTVSMIVTHSPTLDLCPRSLARARGVELVDEAPPTTREPEPVPPIRALQVPPAAEPSAQPSVGKITAIAIAGFLLFTALLVVPLLFVILGR